MIWGYPYFWKHPNCSYHLVEFIIWNILEPSFLFYATLFSGNLKNVFCPKAKTKRSFAGDSKWPFHIFHPLVGGHLTQQPLKKGHKKTIPKRSLWLNHQIHHPDVGRKNTTYIRLIYCLLGDYLSPIPPVVREPETAIIYGPRFRPVSAGPAPEGPFWSDLFRLGKKKGRPEPKEIFQQKPQYNTKNDIVLGGFLRMAGFSWKKSHGGQGKYPIKSTFQGWNILVQ